MKPEKENLPRQLIRCSKCNKPLADVRGSLAYIKTKPGDGTGIKVHHDTGGSFEVNCSCGGQFIRTQKTLPMTYVVTKKKNPVDKPPIAAD